MINEKDMEHSIGQMVVNIQENGKMVNNMVKVYIHVKKVKGKVYGRMGNE